jgi:hypothetical protein
MILTVALIVFLLWIVIGGIVAILICPAIKSRAREQMSAVHHASEAPNAAHPTSH